MAFSLRENKRKSLDVLRDQILSSGATPLVPEGWSSKDFSHSAKDFEERHPQEWEMYLRLLRLDTSSQEYRHLQEKIEQNVSFPRETQRAVLNAWSDFASRISPHEKERCTHTIRSLVLVEPSEFSPRTNEVVLHGGRYFPLDFQDIVTHLSQEAHISIFVSLGAWSAGGAVLFDSEAEYLARELEIRGISPNQITYHALGDNTPKEVDEALYRMPQGEFTIIAHRLHARRVMQTYKARNIIPQACFSPRQQQPFTPSDIARSLMEIQRLQVYAQKGDIAPLSSDQQRECEALFLKFEERGPDLLEALHRECPDK